MSLFVAPFYGKGGLGRVVQSSPATKTLTNAACTGTAGTKTLNATGSFTPGQRITIMQMKGTNYGKHEDNYVGAYSAGVITTILPLSYTYSSPAQVVVVDEYDTFKLDSGITLTIPAWAGAKDGMWSVVCRSLFDIAGTLELSGKGFRGGSGGAKGTTGTVGTQGESVAASQAQSSVKSNNGGGGGGFFNPSVSFACGGGGGGNGAVGSVGHNNSGLSGTVGEAAAVEGSNDLVTMVFGGGGGGGGGGKNTGVDGAAGGNGGGILIVKAPKIVVSGFIKLNGTDGGAAGGSNDNTGGGGGGGGGGSALLFTEEGILGSGIITANPGNGGADAVNLAGGGNGGVGRIAVAKVKGSGTTTPTFYEYPRQRYQGRLGIR